MHQDFEEEPPYNYALILHIRPTARPLTYAQVCALMQKQRPVSKHDDPVASWDTFLASLTYPFDERTKKRLNWVRWMREHTDHFSEEKQPTETA